MKTSSKVGFALIALMALGIQHASAHHLVKSCPAGTAIQGVDFYRQKLLCVPVGGGSGALKVMDANKQEVGVFVGFGWLARLVNNEWVQLSFDQNGFNGNASALYYESADCTGPAYIPELAVIPKVPAVTVNGTSATLYSAVPGSSADRNVQSFQNVNPAGLDLCQPMAASVQTLGVTQTTTISNNPPFSISQ